MTITPFPIPVTVRTTSADNPAQTKRLADYICVEYTHDDRWKELIAAAARGDAKTVREIYHWARGLEERSATLATMAGEFLNELGAQSS